MIRILKKEYHKPLLAIMFLSLIISGTFMYQKVTPKVSKAPIAYVEASWVTNFSDDRALVGFADNVFIGKVKAQKDTKKYIGHPATQYEVEVLDNIKGNLNGVVTVNHEAGYDGETLVIFKGDSVIETGKIYLFAARYDAEQDFYVVVPQFGKQLIEDEAKIKEYKDKYAKAYKEEIPFKYKNKP